MSARSLTGISTHSNCSLTLRVDRRIGWRRPRNIRRKESRQKLLNRRLDCSNTNAKLSRTLGRRRRPDGITFNRSSPGKFDVFSPYRSRVRRRRAVHRTVVQRTNVTRIKIIRCVFRSKGTFQQGSTEIEIQNAVRLFFPVRVVKRREEICRGAANFDYSMQQSTGGASPYPKSVIGNDEGGFARTWRTKTYSGREKGGGSKTSGNPKPTDQFCRIFSRLYRTVPVPVGISLLEASSPAGRLPGLPPALPALMPALPGPACWPAWMASSAIRGAAASGADAECCEHPQPRALRMGAQC